MSEFRSHNVEFAANQDNESKAQRYLDEFWQKHDVIVNRQNACQDFDAIYQHKGTAHTVEEKFRQIASVREDILLEIVQALEAQGWGWFAKTPAQRLVYVLCNADWKPVKLFSFRFADLRDWYLKNYLPGHRVGTYVCSTHGFGITINLSLPLKEIPKGIYKEMNCLD